MRSVVTVGSVDLGPWPRMTPAERARRGLENLNPQSLYRFDQPLHPVLRYYAHRKYLTIERVHL